MLKTKYGVLCKEWDAIAHKNVWWGRSKLRDNLTTQSDVEIAYENYAQKLDELDEAVGEVADCCNKVVHFTFETAWYAEETAKHIKLTLKKMGRIQLPLI
jgi:hypothetical protein